MVGLLPHPQGFGQGEEIAGAVPESPRSVRTPLESTLVRFQSILTRGSSRRLPWRLSTTSGWLKKTLTASAPASGSILAMVKCCLGLNPSLAVAPGRSWAAAVTRHRQQAAPPP